MEAYNIWHKDIGLEVSRIIRIEGNFWDIKGLQDQTLTFSMHRGRSIWTRLSAEEMYPGGENENAILKYGT
ncbi:hypothetical protein ACVNP0_11975 [Staphylococcus aureus]